MAVLGATSLTGCNSIPSFIASGSKMTFQNATVPVSWTKDTAPNESMIRITNTTLSPGGSLAFSTVFQASKPLGGTTSSNNLYVPGANVSGNASLQITTAAAFNPVQLSNVTSTEVNLSAHIHQVYGGTTLTGYAPGAIQGAPAATSPGTITGVNAGSVPGQHLHTSSGSHSHGGSKQAPHTHPISTSHNHSISGSEDFAIRYVDIVIASKD